jgi:hypothetical protein
MAFTLRHSPASWVTETLSKVHNILQCRAYLSVATTSWGRWGHEQLSGDIGHFSAARAIRPPRPLPCAENRHFGERRKDSTNSSARQSIEKVGFAVPAEGRTDVLTTDSPMTPRTPRSSPTTAPSSEPILSVPTG